MPETTPARAGSYPSRRALRAARERREAQEALGSGRHGRVEPATAAQESPALQESPVLQESSAPMEAVAPQAPPPGSPRPSRAAARQARQAPPPAAAPNPAKESPVNRVNPASPIPPVASIPLPDPAPACAGVVPPIPPGAPRPRRRRVARALTASAALSGAAILAFAFTTSGLAAPAPVSGEASAVRQQHLGTGFSPAAAYEVLDDISAESLPDDAPLTFSNYADAAVQYPFASPVLLTDGFGERVYPVAGFHDAQDFAATFGTPIQAIADGVVLEAGWAQDGCGFGLKLQHRIDRQEVTSRYCHMVADSHSLAVGDRVTVAQEVGRVGATGIAFGAHLHFVVAVDGQAVDPMPFLLKYNRSTRP